MNNRKPFELQSKIGRTVFHEGREFLYFSGTAYLGMGSVGDFEKQVMEGISKYGICHGLSRVNNVRLSVYEQFEVFFAEKAKAEKSLLWSSGFLAGTAAINYLKKSAHQIFIAPHTHPAVLADGLHCYPDPNFDHWIGYCKETCAQLHTSNILIVANAVDPLKPAVHDFDWIKDLPSRHHYTLLIDDSHAFGILGEDIFGTYSQWKYLPVNLVISGSLGKGLSIPSGIILGDEKTISGISQLPIFRASSPPSPGLLYAFLHGQHLFQAQREKYLSNVNLFKSLLRQDPKFKYSENFPVFSFPDQNWVNLLEKAGIIVSSFPYPMPTDPCSNRIVISGYHEESDILLLHKVISSL
ncbi:aminotransferase class I/II-fold pyridoxal phosphate-dependent enzyme [Aquiflexum sp. TKW24L]|uniref:aminotransferase class I/II-fold pyridoxal phosphate-dependent enzyme n=1 Tax=Aquiflexum sp. TKW24L TaxID=2942212 RepID=UPI0020C1583E|nr:aminotransferase class I/II-fold pyridoxal phosphate-dependent enzyme [Aquiflexum sp. TKW24L]MCL6258463.1 aminotransferase class I/II-fold pyridoxal phosphate-dependent enzyme [Aquiflexum sp. TKW24L]